MSTAERRDDDILALERYLPYRLSVLSNTVSREIARRYQRHFGLTIPEWRVMAVLGRFPDKTASEIVGLTAMDKVPVSRAVARLEQAGYLQKTTDPADRRRTVLRLSQAGRRVYRRIVPTARDYEAELLSALTPETEAALDRIVETLTVRARQLAGQG